MKNIWKKKLTTQHNTCEPRRSREKKYTPKYWENRQRRQRTYLYVEEDRIGETKRIGDTLSKSATPKYKTQNETLILFALRWSKPQRDPKPNCHCFSSEMRTERREWKKENKNRWGRWRLKKKNSVREMEIKISDARVCVIKMVGMNMSVGSQKLEEEIKSLREREWGRK